MSLEIGFGIGIDADPRIKRVVRIASTKYSFTIIQRKID